MVTKVLRIDGAPPHPWGARRLLARSGAVVVSALLAAGLAPLHAFAQDPVPPTAIPPQDGGIILSMGQPPTWLWHGGLVAGSYGGGENREFLGYAELGVYKDFFSPVASVLGLTAEGYVGGRAGESDVLDGGLRALLSSPVLRLAGGVDYNVKDAAADFILRLTLPIRRSGFPLRGGMFQADWIPARGHTWSVGFTLPIGQPWRGKTRPRHAHAALSSSEVAPVRYASVDPELTEALVNVRESAHWINRLTSPFIDQGHISRGKAYENFEKAVRELEAHIATTDSLFPEGHTHQAEIRLYHQELERAFSIAVTGVALPIGESTAEGRRLAAGARSVVLEEVILPYNRLLGQRKIEDTVRGFGPSASLTFREWLAMQPDIPGDRIEAVEHVAHLLLEIVEENRDLTTESWGDSRLGWIPLQYALIPEQHDTQAELDDILGRAVGKRWAVGNRTWYVVNAQFRRELARSIERAEDYHVLWIHDINPLDASGKPDEATYDVMVNRYLASLTRAVERYDETARLPVYVIIFDQHYYELKNSRLWLNVLESPLDETFPFPSGSEYDWMRQGFEQQQAALRRAVASSGRLQDEATRFGDKWLRNRIKVHVNITHPADPNYFSQQVLPILGYPDNIMRDHRKLAFYDITEEDPYRGMAFYSGMGIGEHYIGATWEDRALMVQGPAILDLKYAAREVLLDQGFREDEIPWPLRPRSKPADYDDLVQESEVSPSSRAVGMELHNEVGYQPKPINVARSILYTLMPPGSVAILPDQLWNNSFYASLLLGNSLRGARNLIIAPALENAPGREGFPQMSRAQELFARLIRIQDILGDEIAEAGGMLKTGLYAVEVEMADLPGALRLVREGLEGEPWLAALFGFDPSWYAFLGGADEFLAGFAANYAVKDAESRRPQLHLKASLFADQDAMRFFSTPEAVELAKHLVGEYAQALSGSEEETDIRDLYGQVGDNVETALRAWERAVPPERVAKAAAYLSVGSANQDYRSMFMDGEVVFLISGMPSVGSIFDFVFLASSATWVDSLDELEELLPEQSGFKWQLGRLIKDAL